MDDVTSPLGNQTRDPSGNVRCNPGEDLQATLRPYQTDRIRWLWFMMELKLGACLTDDMGLRKTIQVIDWLLQLKKRDSAATRKPACPNLLIVSASLIGNWKLETGVLEVRSAIECVLGPSQ